MLQIWPALVLSSSIPRYGAPTLQRTRWPTSWQNAQPNLWECTQLDREWASASTILVEQAATSYSRTSLNTPQIELHRSACTCLEYCDPSEFLNLKISISYLRHTKSAPALTLIHNSGNFSSLMHNIHSDKIPRNRAFKSYQQYMIKKRMLWLTISAYHKQWHKSLS